MYLSLSSLLARLLKHSHQHVKLCFCSLSLICNSPFYSSHGFWLGLCYVSRRHGGYAVIFTLAAFPFFLYHRLHNAKTDKNARRCRYWAEFRSFLFRGGSDMQAGGCAGLRCLLLSRLSLLSTHIPRPTRTPHTYTTISLALHTHSHLTHIIPCFPHTHHVFCRQATRKHHAHTLKPSVYHVTSHTQRAHNTRPPFTPFHSRPKLINIPPVTPVIPP